MWLGLSAVVVAMVYALVKFLTAAHMRRLRDDRIRLHYDLKKSQQRLESLEGKLQVEGSNKGSILQKAQTARHFKDEMYARLRIELPDALLPELRKCINRNPVPESRGVRLFHDLKLSDKISAALEAVSIAVFEFADEDPAAHAVLKGQLVQLLDEESVPHATPELRDENDRERIVAAFDTPDSAMGFARRLVGRGSAALFAHLQGVLMSAANLGDDGDNDLSHVFARSLDLAQEMADTAPAGSLLMNEAAYSAISDRHGVEEFSKVEHLYTWAWQAGPAETPGGEGETVPEPGAADSSSSAASPPEGGEGEAPPQEGDQAP